MALIDPIHGRMSGAVGGVVFSHNAGGQYLRQRTTPVNPATSQQQAVRNAVNFLSNNWQNLTTAEQEAWENYAANVPLTNRLGAQIFVSGLAMYVRSNASIIAALGASYRIDAAPTIFTLGESALVTIDDATPPSGGLDIAFDVNDAWVGENGAYLLIYMARPQNPSVNFFKGPYRFAGAAAGSSTTPPTSPFTIATTPFVFASAQQLFIQARVRRGDGRLSGPTQDAAIVA